MATNTRVTREQLIDILKKRPYPKGVKVLAICTIIMVIIAGIMSPPYLKSAVYLERCYEAVNIGSAEQGMYWLEKSIAAAPNAKKPWSERILIALLVDDPDAETLLNKLLFTEEERNEIREAAKSIKEEMKE
jgi:hypothetical protein